jgi:hypothetical protein
MLSNSPPAPWPDDDNDDDEARPPAVFQSATGMDPVDTGLEHYYSLGCPLEGFYADERSYVSMPAYLQASPTRESHIIESPPRSQGVVRGQVTTRRSHIVVHTPSQPAS